MPALRLPPPGAEIGRFRLLRVVGEGARGVVYEADDPAFDRSVAIKILKPALHDDAAAVEEFRTEAEATAQVQHENVVSILNRGEQDGILYYVMEFVDGPCLEDRLKEKGALPWKEAVEIAIQIARGLAEAHHLGLIHRDVKPGNILLFQNGQARLTDFGIVKDISSLEGFLVTGRSVGTAAYASPEQCLGKRLLPATDIYSLGATLYHMLTGRFPFPGPSDQAFMTGHVKKEATPPIDLVPGLPRPLSNAVMRMMAKSPLARFETMDQALRDLEPIARGHKPLGGAAGAHTGPIRLEARRSERTASERVAARGGGASTRVWILVGILVAVIVVAFVAVAL